MTPEHRSADHADGHVVLFYLDDEQLARQAGDYLAGALNQDGTAVVIATRLHRNMIRQRLAAAGTDLDAAEASGRYVERDADETLSTFMIGGWPGPAAFWQAIRPLVMDACTTGSPVRVFGEMVAVLWDSRQPGAALELELLWNQLIEHYPIGLLCGYRAHTVRHPDHADALDALCRVHSATLGPKV